MDKKGSQIHLKHRHEEFASLMERQGLIKINGSRCSVKKLGLKVFKSGGWLKHLSDLEENHTELELKQLEKEELELNILKHQNKIKDKEREIIKLTAKNLRLQNKQMKRAVLYSIIGFLAGIISANLKDILILLNLMSPE
ncbi:hypothetical protein [Winogradskyella undariae]|uniref:hypothetical protein n=1 Tax=Winogradskyella undariae TaxID=1285465 RepID=UPI0015CEC540|nr:hypothetical protein [Winogradskyella undariae]